MIIIHPELPSYWAQKLYSPRTNFQLTIRIHEFEHRPGLFHRHRASELFHSRFQFFNADFAVFVRIHGFEFRYVRLDLRFGDAEFAGLNHNDTDKLILQPPLRL